MFFRRCVFAYLPCELMHFSAIINIFKVVWIMKLLLGPHSTHEILCIKYCYKILEFKDMHTYKAGTINLFRVGVRCSLPSLPSLSFLSRTLSSPRRNFLNPAKWFEGALLVSLSGGEQHLQPPDTFLGLWIHEKCVHGGAEPRPQTRFWCIKCRGTCLVAADVVLLC